MKKLTILFFALLFVAPAAFAQMDWHEHSSFNTFMIRSLDQDTHTDDYEWLQKEGQVFSLFFSEDMDGAKKPYIYMWSERQGDMVRLDVKVTGPNSFVLQDCQGEEMHEEAHELYEKGDFRMPQEGACPVQVHWQLVYTDGPYKGMVYRFY